MTTFLLIGFVFWAFLRLADWREGKGLRPKPKAKGIGWFGFGVCIVILIGGNLLR